MSGFNYTDKSGIKHKIYPSQQPYISDCGQYYLAFARSIDEKEIVYEFNLKWEIKEGYDIRDSSDESNACNWDDFEVTELGEEL